MVIDYIEIDVSMLHTMIVREIEHSEHLIYMNIQVAMGRKPPVSPWGILRTPRLD